MNPLTNLEAVYGFGGSLYFQITGMKLHLKVVFLISHTFMFTALQETALCHASNRLKSSGVSALNTQDLREWQAAVPWEV